MIFRRLSASGIGVLSQVLGNVAFFVLLARMWGPSEFGYFIYMYSISSLFVLAVDYGYPQRVLREAPRLGFRNRVNLVAGTSFKCAVALVVIVLTCVISAFGEDVSIIVILLAMLLGSFAEYFSSHIRALGNHYSNSKDIFVSNALLVVTLFTIVKFNDTKLSYLQVSLILLIAKLVYLALSYKKIVSMFDMHLRRIKFRHKLLLSEMRVGFAYAIEVFFVRASGVLDTIILRFIAGDLAVGLYQSGQRMLQGFFPFAQVANNVFMPMLSTSRGKAFRVIAVKLLSVCLVAGGVALAFFVGFGEVLIEMVFGSEYIDIESYLWQFGVLAFLRFASAPLAIVLTCTGNQVFRVKSNAFSIIIMLVLAVILIPAYGIGGITMALIISNLAVIGFYSYGIYIHRGVMVEYDQCSV